MKRCHFHHLCRLVGPARPTRRGQPGRAAGFTLFDVLISIAILAVLVAVVLPSFTPDDRQRLNAAAMLLASDIEFAQVMTIANPQDPLVVRFDANEVRYWIAYARSPNSPIDRPDTNEPYDVTLGVGRAGSAAGIRMGFRDMPDQTLEFESHGGLLDFTTTPIVELTTGSKYPSVEIEIAPMTGTLMVTYERGP